MTGRVAWFVSKGSAATTCLTLLLGGCIDAPNASVPGPTDADASDLAAPFVGSVDWNGHILVSETDALMHTSPTEGVLWPYEQAGTIVEIPEGVTAIEVAVAWEGPGRFRIHLHSYSHDGAYVGHQSTPEQQPQNPHCLRVPAENVAPGHWMVMIHSVDAVQTDFTMTVTTETVTATLVDERHGHDRANDLTGPAREEHESDECQLWTVPA